MATSDPTPGPPTGARAPRSSMFWIVPALTFLIGALLGGVTVWLGSDSGNGATASSQTTASSGASSSAPTAGGGQSATTVVIPAECAQIADELSAVQQDLSSALESLKSLDANGLAKTVDDLRTRQARITALLESCRGITVSSPTPSAAG